MALWEPKGQSNRENKRCLNEMTILRLLDKVEVRQKIKKIGMDGQRKKVEDRCAKVS